MSPSFDQPGSDDSPPEQIVHREIVDALERIRERVNTEIGQYPSPIPACDAQFNHLLEQRSRIGRELARLRESDRAMWSLSQYADYFDELVSSSDLIEPDSERKIHAYFNQTDVD